MPADNRWLQKRRQTWFVVVEVPRPLRARLGRRITRTLKTHDLALARARRHAVMGEIQRTFEEARRGLGAGGVVAEALEWRSVLAEVREQRDREFDGRDGFDPMEPTLEALHERAERISRTVGGAAAAEAFRGIALGEATPLGLHVETWLAEGGAKGPLRDKTKVEHRSAVSKLTEWLMKEQRAATVEAVTRRVAGDYVSKALLPSGRHHRTIAKTVHTLTTYWKWMKKRGHVPDELANPWAEQAPGKGPQTGHEEDSERAFTRAEMVALLGGTRDQTMLDFMRVAALTGMRREEIGRLTVADCAEGVFVVRLGKTAAARRRVPIHPDLVALVAQRSEDKPVSAFLFSELSSASTERTDPFGKRFATYRRSLSIQEGEGRRSRVNFHSFRRWFVTEAINAGQPPHMVSLIVGHSEGRKGMTLGRYWAGGQDEDLRAVVEAVRLPLRPQVRSG